MKLKPDGWMDSIYDISPKQLIEQNYKAVILDLDNTLIASHETQATPIMKKWLQQAQQANLQVYVISNNRYQRVANVIEPLNIPFTSDALKPSRKGFDEALRYFKDIHKNEIVVIGDQVITDVIGAKRNGLKVILVKPLSKKDNIYTILNRWIESLLLKYMGIYRHKNWRNMIGEYE